MCWWVAFVKVAFCEDDHFLTEMSRELFEDESIFQVFARTWNELTLTTQVLL